ncbi:MAG: hypothetical protein HRT68_14425 [Flavobacteriaceae bacterium]|nr:hypothetical protein [Flavobacteriaceae bacterium]
MIRIILLASFILLFISCQKETKNQLNPKSELQKEEPELSIPEKIAYAHGFDQWNKVNKISFTFNVDHDSSHYERNWIWFPKENKVSFKSASDSLTYFRKNMDSLIQKTDSGFINDKYWLLLPYNLIWDKNNYSFTHTTNVLSPIAKNKMQKLTIVYANEGGYTPGDAYDIYFEDNFKLKEWVFRKGNAKEASLATTWEDYTVLNGLKIAQSHQKDSGNWKLHFTNLKVE